MFNLRKAEERGHFDHGWLQTYHSFSFADYYDPAHMSFRSLRVINEDFVQSGKGFPTHPHKDMEILTYVLEGSLEHKDSMGNGSVIRPGDVQRMSAGTGVTHSEFNPSPSEPVHLLQIWILPAARGLVPSYEQKNFSAEEKRGKFRLVASPEGSEGSVTIHQDAKVFAAIPEPGKELSYAVPAGRHAWVQVARGSVHVAGQSLAAGDGLAVSDERSLKLKGGAGSEVLLFDLA